MAAGELLGSGPDGDRWLSFEEFYRAQFATTLAVVSVLRGPNVVAEELVQDAFVRAYRRWGAVGVMARPDLWVQRVALNLASSQLRRLGAEARALARVGGRRGSASELPELEEMERFWQLVRQLPRQQMRVVALHYAADLAVDDVAAVLELAPGTVKAHLHAARRSLAAMIEEHAHG